VYRISMKRAGANQAQGAVNFSATESGLDFASFLLGLPDNTLSPEGEPQTFPRATRIGAYVNDDWKVNPRLTVNMGLRWDYIGVPIDAKGLWRTFDIPGYGTDVGRGKGYQTPDGRAIPVLRPWTPPVRSSSGSSEPGFFMPRVGLAFRPAKKWVLRAGAGWFDNIEHLN
jgi:outer membrane receptor protein involved in Fe transport